MIRDALIKLVDKNDLTPGEMTAAMTEIMSGETSEIEISAFLTALKMKGETVDEISSAAKVMREKAESVNLGDYYTLDTCGTGGDTMGTYNISTASAFIAAVAGIKVVKHGNRSISSSCGSADVLEALGVNIALDPDGVKKCVEQVGMGFMFAPSHHKAMKHVMGVRRTLGFRTMFNILGPLSNPAGAKAQVLGVFDKSLTAPLANVLKNIGLERALVVHGKDGLDEISVCDTTYVAELCEGKITEYEIAPEDFGMRRAVIDDIKGGTAKENADIIRDIFEGKDTSARLDILLLNAGAALYAGKKAQSIKEGAGLAGDIIKSGKALHTLDRLAEFSNTL